MKPLVLILDAGHGGIIIEDGESIYTTAPNKMYLHNNGVTAYEGIDNRRVTEKILYEWKKTKNPYVYLDSNLDCNLTTRVDLANKVKMQYGDRFNYIYLSCHFNAGKGTGIEVFTSVGETDSDKCAQIIGNDLKEEFDYMKFRSDTSDGDLDKESQFYVLKHTQMRAVLVELGFFDNWNDYQLIRTDYHITNLARCIVDSLIKIQAL